MATYTSRLQARDSIAEGTMAFHLEKPPGFSFKPGQAIDLILRANDPEGSQPDARHTFSLVSAPFEDELIIATRMRASAFKRALGALPIGAPLMIEGPSGSLSLHKDQTRAGVFIAGGIGITPFISILRQAAKNQLQQDLRLLYSNHRPEDCAFLAELQQLEALNPRFHLIATMTQMERSTQAWSQRTSRIDAELVKQAIRDLCAPLFYIAGPGAMVEAMQRTLAAAGVDDDDVRSETFYGY